MGLFSKDPVKQEIKQLKRQQDENRLDLMLSGAKPGSPEWDAAEKRNVAMHKEIKKLERGR